MKTFKLLTFKRLMSRYTCTCRCYLSNSSMLERKQFGFSVSNICFIIWKFLSIHVQCPLYITTIQDLKHVYCTCIAVSLAFRMNTLHWFNYTQILWTLWLLVLTISHPHVFNLQTYVIYISCLLNSMILLSIYIWCFWNFSWPLKSHYI